MELFSKMVSSMDDPNWEALIFMLNEIRKELQRIKLNIREIVDTITFTANR